MFLNDFEIYQDAIFIADSHYNSNRGQLKEFLLKLQNKEIITSQLFLMGDIFDFLDSNINYFIKQNQEIIDLLNKLSSNLEIVYFEGNHDFNLQSLFQNIFVISRNKQPLYCTYKSKKVALSHGDIFTSFGYNLYTSIIRNKLFLSFLNLIDINNWLTIRINNWLLNKDICNKDDNFNELSNNRITLYDKDIDMIIEGHFHYGQQNNNYINIPSFACSNKYYLINDNKNIMV